MILWFSNWLSSTIKKLVLPLVLAFVAFTVWGVYKDDRKARTLNVSFDNIDGLSKGAPVYALGALIGKVVSTQPTINSGDINVKILITKKDFPLPGDGTSARIVSSAQRSGARVIELENIQFDKKGPIKAINPLPHESALRILQDFLQMSKDFAVDSIRFLGSPTAQQYKHDFERSMRDMISSIEQGTVKDDAMKQIAKLNDLVRRLEAGEIVDTKSKTALKDQLMAMKKTLEESVSVSDVYKHSAKDKKK